MPWSKTVFCLVLMQFFQAGWLDSELNRKCCFYVSPDIIRFCFEDFLPFLPVFIYFFVVRSYFFIFSGFFFFTFSFAIILSIAILTLFISPLFVCYIIPKCLKFTTIFSSSKFYCGHFLKGCDAYCLVYDGVRPDIAISRKSAWANLK